MTPSLPSTSELAPGDLVPSISIEQLGEAIAGIAAGLHAATYQLLVLLKEFDARSGWNNGFLSCAHWLSWRTSIDLGAAREKVRVARALPELPLLSGALRRGEISYAKVRALTRIATPATEERLLAVAYHGTAAQVERLVRAWRRCDRIEEGRKHLSRSVATYQDEDGMVILRARLTPEQGALVQRALEAASEHLYHESRGAAAPDNIEEEVTSGQRRADALALMAECVLRADLARGSAGDTHQIVLHIDAAKVADPTQHAVLELADGGIGVSAETSRRISCDASVAVMREAGDGSVLDVGRKTRVISTPIRRALAARDGRCVFPGCTARRCDAHHLVHWVDGGPTALDNLVLLCRRHHTLVHEQAFGVERAANGDVVFHRPDGRRIEASPRLAWNGGQLLRESVNARSLRCWDGTPFNVAYAIDVLHPRANP
ncbi:MAG TPA: DUF222 domain-containing protein [Vicinamibacterales bacterium]|jgi:hypothetical protein|nr:DUF222 domain-containing protein [Vicinamibacterales bacterium]